MEQLEADLNSANKHIRSLRDELQQHQSSIFKLEADGLGQTVSGRVRWALRCFWLYLFELVQKWL